MNISTATPVEIDTEIARLGDLLARQYSIRDRAYAELRKYRSTMGPSSIAELEDKIEQAEQQAEQLHREQNPYLCEYDRRRWSRSYLVTNSNGHVHSSMRCRTCFLDTEFCWLIDWSGKDREQIITDAQDQICLECFPEAKDRVFRKGDVAPPEVAAERQARAEAKDVKARDKAKKAITNPDGSKLRTVETARNDELVEGREIETEIGASRAASEALGDFILYGSHPFDRAWLKTARRCLEALAAKHGTSYETEVADQERRLIQKCKRDGCTYSNTWISLLENTKTTL